MEVKTSKDAQQQPKILRSKELEWINLDLTHSSDVSWFRRDSGLGEDIVKLFLDRGQAIVQLQLRGGTFVRVLYDKLGKDPSDDQSFDLGFWIEARRVITFRRGPPPGALIERLEAEFGSDGGPGTPWGFFASAVSLLASYIEKNVTSIESTVDRLEDMMLKRGAPLPIDELAILRKRFIYMRRYKAPLAGLLETIARDAVLDTDEDARSDLKEAAASLTQSEQLSEFYVERVSVVHEQIQNQLSSRMGNATYRLTMVATVFLPLSFLTGLLGINVAGIPGTHDPYAFWLVCLFLILVTIASSVIVARVTKP
jgi:zinc transporter